MAGPNKRVGAINVGLFAETKKFQKSIGKARKMLKRFTGTIKRSVFNLQTLGVALATGAFAKFTMDAARGIDSLAKTADKLGITTEALAGLRLAAAEAGVAEETLNKALTMLVKNVSEAASGTGEAKDALEQLGLNIQRLNNMAPDQQFREIARAISNVRNQQDQLRISTDLFGSRAAQLVNLLRGGTPVLDEAARAARDLGLAVDRESARGVERALDAWGRFKSAIQGVVNQIAITLMPMLEMVSDSMTSLLSSNGTAVKFGQGVGKFAIEVFKQIGNGFQFAIQALLDVIAGIARFIESVAPGVLSIFQKHGGLSDADAGSASMQIGSMSANAFNAARKFRNLPGFGEVVTNFQSQAAERAQRQMSQPANDPFGARRQKILEQIARESRNLTPLEKRKYDEARQSNDWLKRIADNTAAGAVGGLMMTDMGAR